MAELLKEIAPGVTRRRFCGSGQPTGIGQFAVIQSVAPSLGVEVIPINVRNASRLARRLRPSRAPGDGGPIVTAGPLMAVHRN